MLRPFKNSTKWNLFLSLDYWLGHLLLHHLQTCSGKFKIIKIFFSLGLKASRILHLTAPFLPDGVFDFKNRASSYLDTTIFTITEQILMRWSVENYGLWEYIPWKWCNFKNFLWLSCFVKKLCCEWTVEICYVIVKNKNNNANGGKHSYIL